MPIQRGLLMSFLVSIATLFSGSAFALHMIPTSTTFVAQGPFNVTVLGTNIQCTAVFIVVTDSAGQPTVTDAKFQGQTLCSLVKATQLPWKIEITSMTTGTIHNVALTVTPITCTGNLPVIFSPLSTLTIPSSPMTSGCTVGGTLTVSPSYLIVSP
ncbi:hypothetical protein [Dyella sp. GSA-30]|uniref:hypothetical protein n=1 Tax=Dyella sp. GSA-30 TaxID=2994496 RepID=UPI002490B254|nr:hypothetical protein [Dyella sp. GSA-30]BDU18605.1 hypothetical protein DYGSA30_00620 [Dyella sp. GSA-30]